MDPGTEDEPHLLRSTDFGALRASVVAGLAGAAGGWERAAEVDFIHEPSRNLQDNCPKVPDPTVFDADQDGIGNACDTDYNNDGIVTGTDFDIFMAAYGSPQGARAGIRARTTTATVW